MKICNVVYNGNKFLGFLEEHKFYPFANSIYVDDLYELIGRFSLEELNSLKKDIKLGKYFKEEELIFLPPFDHYKENVLCLGLNYALHIEESNRYKLGKSVEVKEPVFFSKRVAVVTGDNDAIDGHFDMVDSLDYECELAVIIGKDTYKAEAKDAIDSIFGFAVCNDVSARNIQTKHTQWHLGKSLDTFCPMGPFVVTKDEFKFPLELNVKSYVNGELRQNDNTRNFIHKIDEVIETLSCGMTLKAGSIILTGTPSGVGMGMTPPCFLKSGDEIVCEIENVGTLHNRVL